MHTGARFHPDRHKGDECGSCAPPQLRTLLVEVSASLCYHDIGKYARGSTDFWCHLLFARIAPVRHPVGPKKSNKALGFYLWFWASIGSMEWPPLRSPPTEVSAGLCHHDIGKYACGSTSFWCHLLFAGIAPTRYPVDPKKFNMADQQAPNHRDRYEQVLGPWSTNHHPAFGSRR